MLHSDKLADEITFDMATGALASSDGFYRATGSRRLQRMPMTMGQRQ
jgi:hypothetical protein